MQRKIYNKGFTLAELIVAMVVAGVVLAAVSTLAFAMSQSSRGTEDISLKQSQVRFASLSLKELIRSSSLIYSYDQQTGSVVLWHDSDLDNVDDANEMIVIEAGTGRNYIKIQEFESEPYYIVPQCSNVQFLFDYAPPQSRNLSIAFELIESGISRQYRISGFLHCWSGNLLDGDILISDDD